MKTLFAALAGFALIGAVGATQVNAQGVRIDIRKADKHVVIDTTHTSNRTAPKPLRQPQRNEKKSSGHFITVQKKVWVPGHYEERTVRVLIPASHEDVRERRVDSRGHVYFVTVCRVIPAHYEDQCRQVFVPGCYEIRTEKVWVEDNCGCDDGHGNDHGKNHGNDHDAGYGHGGSSKGKKHNRGRRGSGRH
ncbi:MAG: hypothetical protein KDB90_03675 [Planctomycetes bacterium]|nr:hypothetical protein [Planctomycetota bacterium]